MKNLGPIQKTVVGAQFLFVAFGASKEAYAGAWYFLNRSFSDVPNISAMINLDMVGTGYNGFYAYTSSNADINALLNSLKAGLQPILPGVPASEPYPSDHRAFYSMEIPSVMFTTGRYSQYDTERDTQSIIDYETMERELEYLYNFTEVLANTDVMLWWGHCKHDDVPDTLAMFVDWQMSDTRNIATVVRRPF